MKTKDFQHNLKKLKDILPRQIYSHKYIKQTFLKLKPLDGIELLKEKNKLIKQNSAGSYLQPIFTKHDQYCSKRLKCTEILTQQFKGFSKNNQLQLL